MKSIIIPACFIFFISLSGCSGNAEKDQTAVPASSNFLTTVPNTNNDSNTVNTVNTDNTVLPVSDKTSLTELNPEHGKPGHRCEIAVGAPLNSATAVNTTNASQTTTTSPGTNTITTTTATNNIVEVKPAATTVAAVAPGMNPQHGQPGHRCDIDVGAPLNSEPKSKSTPQIIAPPSTTVNTINVNPGSNVTPPSIPVTTGTATTTAAPGMNPQHGQPGHRCDIAVGAPLNSKPKQ